MSLASLWWGPWFPKAWFGPWFSDGVPPPDIVPPTPPVGAATFALSLESGATLTMSWITDIVKSYAGLETRSSSLSDPKRKISGQAYLVGDATRAVRARMARYAAIGSPFTLALPYEELTIVSDSIGGQVFVSSTANSDWVVPGTTVVVQNGSQSVQGVIQTYDSSSITLDVSPGELGIAGGRIMPCLAVFLEPQQGFARFPGRKSAADDPDIVERWGINCTVIPFGFRTDERKAMLSLADQPEPMSGPDIRTWLFTYTIPGIAGNLVTLQFIADGMGTGSVTFSGDDVFFHFHDGTTSVANAKSHLMSLANIQLTGAIDTDILFTDTEFGPLPFAGGIDQSYGTMGIGAVLTSYAGRPVWDRRLQLDGTALDSVQSMTEIVDMGGVPINIGSALRSDWGRQVLLRGDTSMTNPTRAFGSRVDDDGEIDITSIPVGTIGNGRSVQLIADGSGTGTYVDGDAAVFHYQFGVTTYGDLAAAGASSTRFSFSVITDGLLLFGSTVTLSGGEDGAMVSDWQWLKLFLSTVQGRRRAFWLPTWRNDLTALEVGASTITIEGPYEDSGDFFAWYPSLRDRLQLIEDDGTVTYTQITGALDNGDGTVTLTVADTIASVPVLVSWLELCRFEADDFPVTFTGSWFALNAIAHVVTQ